MMVVLDNNSRWIVAVALVILLAAPTAAICSVEPALSAKDAAEEIFQEESGEVHSSNENEGLFPLWKDLAEGRDLPPPIGLSATVGYMATEYGFGQVELSLGDEPLYEYDLTGSAVAYGTTTVGVKGDLWLLPFLDVMLLTGYTDVDVRVTLHDIPVGVEGVPPEPQIGDKILDLHFSGPYYGSGFVLAAGWRDFFITADFIWTTQVLEAKVEGNDDDTVNAFATAPRVGYRAGSTEVWMGARYIESDRRFSGSIDDFNYSLEVFETTWSYLMGMHALIHDHWDVMVEGGIGDRQMVVFNVGYRW